MITAVLWAGGWLVRAPLLETAGFSREVLDRGGRLLRLTLSGDEKYRVFTPLNQMPRPLIDAVLEQEDRYFYFHPGINPVALVRAANSTYVSGDKRLGASTITMQLARMTSTRGSKTLLGKTVQIARALYLETWHSKDEILEAYLNLLPFGANIEGVGAASRVLLRKNISGLTNDEIQQLVKIPQNPTSYNRQAAAAIDRLPFSAPHFVNAALERAQHRRDPSLHLTLERDIQILLEKKLKSHIESNRPTGITNGSALVVDHETMEVLAMAGSADFFDDTIGGQINGVFVRRSPGSTLKPLLYALAIDQGLIHPLTLLKDSPSSFGAFDPENFDQKFLGPLSATEALIQSRNVPAVYLTTRVQKPSFYEFLKSAGVKLPKSEAYYGLALTLGGAEVTMEEMAQLYAALANGGDRHDLRYFQNTKKSPAKNILSGEAAHMVLAMLRENPRSNQRRAEQWVRDNIPLAWKTGTSNGFRDAWTVGLAGPYVIAVWLGNFNNDSNPALIGRDLAAPLFFSIADGLRPKITAPPQWISTAGLSVKKVKVCALSGHLPGKHCHALRETEFIAGKSPISECNIHREVLIGRNGERACDEKQAGLKKQVFEFWPSDLLQLFRAAGLPRRTPPQFSAECRVREGAPLGVAPQIVSPRREVTYSLRVTAGRESEEKIPLSAVADGDVTSLHWFIGSTYLGKSEPAKPLFWTPKPGRHMVRVSDDLGRSDSREVEVRVTR